MFQEYWLLFEECNEWQLYASVIDKTDRNAFMPKLVIKQQQPPPSAQEKFARALQNILPILLLIIGLATAVSLYLTRETAGMMSVTEALSTQPPPVYTRQDERLKQLGKEFDKLETATESYDKHQQLVTRSEEIMQQLAEMDRIANDLSLSEDDKQILRNRHQYQKDYWESKLVFHRLRLARFKVNNPDTTQDALREAVGSALEAHQVEKTGRPAEATANTAKLLAEPEKVQSVPESAPSVEITPALAEQPTDQQKHAVAESAGSSGTPPAPAETGLPPGVELPPGMCPLFGPGAAACKPGAEDED